MTYTELAEDLGQHTKCSLSLEVHQSAPLILWIGRGDEAKPGGEGKRQNSGAKWADGGGSSSPPCCLRWPPQLGSWVDQLTGPFPSMQIQWGFPCICVLGSALLAIDLVLQLKAQEPCQVWGTWQSRHKSCLNNGLGCLNNMRQVANKLVRLISLLASQTDPMHVSAELPLQWNLIPSWYAGIAAAAHELFIPSQELLPSACWLPLWGKGNVLRRVSLKQTGIKLNRKLPSRPAP